MWVFVGNWISAEQSKYVFIAATHTIFGFTVNILCVHIIRSQAVLKNTHTHGATLKFVPHSAIWFALDSQFVVLFFSRVIMALACNIVVLIFEASNTYLIHLAWHVWLVREQKSYLPDACANGADAQQSPYHTEDLRLRRFMSTQHKDVCMRVGDILDWRERMYSECDISAWFSAEIIHQHCRRFPETREKISVIQYFINWTVCIDWKCVLLG